MLAARSRRHPFSADELNCRPDLSTAEFDMTGVPDFHRRVYDLVRTIPPGQILTYGDIARRLGMVIEGALAEDPTLF